MATIFDGCNKVLDYLDSILPCVESTLGENSIEVETAIREQLYAGLDGDENELTPTYTGDPYFYQRYKNPRTAVREAERYRDWKNDITPPEESHHMHFRPRDWDTPNLFIDGTFHRSIRASVGNGVLSVNTEGFRDGKAIEKKYGEQIFKVSRSSWAWLLGDFILPALERLKKEKLG